MRLDVHAHYFSQSYIDVLERHGAGADLLEPAYRLLHPTREADFAERFAAMDRAHVDKQILSVSGVTPYSLDEKYAIEGARFANDLYAEIALETPARFAAFGVLPMPHVKASLAEIGRVLDELHMWGVTMTLTILGTSLADPSFDPIYAELDRRGAVLFLHPAGSACGSQQLKDTGLTWPLGAPFEDSLAILELLQAGFTQRFPRIRTIVPHLGGTLPFIIQRLDHMAQRFMPGKGVPREEMRKFWYDTVNGYPPSLRLAIETFGLERIVFGTDWPYWKGEAHQLAADYISQAGLTADQIAQIDSGNARALFGERIG
ncbi:MAG TPA: amidohydrolase family protein [Candidatus Lustribacter sp.]|jgi:aminocarboxymuconate-semialdehyde decarboxylase|nr:amidohydrolase family protein [Candidatus Lustribacter sp.]